MTNITQLRFYCSTIFAIKKSTKIFSALEDVFVSTMKAKS